MEDKLYCVLVIELGLLSRVFRNLVIDLVFFILLLLSFFIRGFFLICA